MFGWRKELGVPAVNSVGEGELSSGRHQLQGVLARSRCVAWESACQQLNKCVFCSFLNTR